MKSIFRKVIKKIREPEIKFEDDVFLHRQGLMLFSTLHAAIVMFFIFSIYNFSIGLHLRAGFDFASLSILVLILYYLHSSKNIKVATYIFGAITAIAMTGVVIFDKNNTFGLVWAYAFFILAIPLLGLRIGTVAVLLFYSIITSLSFIGIHEWNHGNWDIVSFYRFLVSSAFFIGMGYFLESSFVKVGNEVSKIREREKIIIGELENLSRSDQLTGLHNRRYFSERLLEEVERIKRNNTPACLIMLDVDLFKSINDTYGHPSGDLVLQEVSAALRSILRNTDLLARWGGEEFMILLPETNSVNASVLAERMRKAIEEMTIKGVRKVTASFGVVEYDSSVETIEAALKYLDNALYSAKKQGRNKVVLAEPALGAT